MTHPYNDHSGAAHYMQTGRMWQVPIGGGFNPTAQDWPAMGSVVEYLAQHAVGARGRDLPAYAVVPNYLGRLEQARDFETLTAREVWIETPKRHLPVALDGEVVRLSPPLHYEVRAKALKVIAPA